jgi:hypothetical protein
MAAYDKGLSMITMLYFHECIFSRCISMLDITPTQINDTPRVPSGIEIGLDIYTTGVSFICVGVMSNIEMHLLKMHS